MKIEKIIHNTEQRFKTVESKNFKEYILNRIPEMLKSFVRGGTLGGVVGYLIGGDVDSIVVGSAAGAVLDGAQDTIRLMGLMNLYNRKDSDKYENQVQKYKEFGWIN